MKRVANMKLCEKGVFPELIGKKAFLDKVVVSLRAIKKESPGSAVKDLVNQPIGGYGKKYARRERGVLRASGNSYELVYGRLMPVLPLMVLTVRSDESPTTARFVKSAINAVCEGQWQAKVSLVEMTFDFKNIPIEFFRRNVFTSAYKFRSLQDKDGRKTFYVGVRTSPWQGRIYQKTRQVVRLEFIFRRPFLRQHRITEVSDLKNLRTLDLTRRLWLRKLNCAGAKQLEIKVAAQESENVRRRIVVVWFRDLPLRESIRAAKKYFGGVPSKLTSATAVDKRLRRMQRRLVV
jgi:hypothetical protein